MHKEHIEEKTMRIQLFVVLAVGLGLPGEALNSESITVSNGITSNDAMLEVFVLPHAHCDVGWLKTVEGYFDDQVCNSVRKYDCRCLIWEFTRLNLVFYTGNEVIDCINLRRCRCIFKNVALVMLAML